MSLSLNEIARYHAECAAKNPRAPVHIFPPGHYRGRTHEYNRLLFQLLVKPRRTCAGLTLQDEYDTLKLWAEDAGFHFVEVNPAYYPRK